MYVPAGHHQNIIIISNSSSISNLPVFAFTTDQPSPIILIPQHQPQTFAMLPLGSTSHTRMWLSASVINVELSPDGCHITLVNKHNTEDKGSVPD